MAYVNVEDIFDFLQKRKKKITRLALANIFHVISPIIR